MVMNKKEAAALQSLESTAAYLRKRLAAARDELDWQSRYVEILEEELFSYMYDVSTMSRDEFVEQFEELKNVWRRKAKEE